jgi:hypothetical protein
MLHQESLTLWNIICNEMKWIDLCKQNKKTQEQSNARKSIIAMWTGQ